MIEGQCGKDESGGSLESPEQQQVYSLNWVTAVYVYDANVGRLEHRAVPLTNLVGEEHEVTWILRAMQRSYSQESTYSCLQMTPLPKDSNTVPTYEIKVHITRNKKRHKREMRGIRGRFITALQKVCYLERATSAYKWRHCQHTPMQGSLKTN